MRMKGKEQAWRRSPISSLAHQIRMNGVRQANILPTCSLDKSNRALYEPEDVRAKKSALVKPESRSSVVTSRAKGMLKQKVLALSTTGVTKENMDAVDRVKETVAVLMQNKGGATDIGSAERRILQPRVARRMAGMNADRRAEFDRRVEGVVERLVCATKRRYVRRQELLDKTGVFHPEANAHRVHTQFWADLNNKVDVTKIEDMVWARMSSEASNAPTGSAAERQVSVLNKTRARHETTAVPFPPQAVAVPSSVSHDVEGGKVSSNTSSKVVTTINNSAQDELKKKYARTGDTEMVPPTPAVTIAKKDTADDVRAVAPGVDSFDGFPGYDEVGRVPTLDEFRAEWVKMKSLNRSGRSFRTATPSLRSQRDNEDGEVAGDKSESSFPRVRRKQQGQERRVLHPQQENNAGCVVSNLSKKDEVFRHFKKYYDKSNHGYDGSDSAGVIGGGAAGGGIGDPLSSIGIGSTGLLQPDLEVIEAVGQHTASVHESRSQNRIGEGTLSASSGRGGVGVAIGGKRASGTGNRMESPAREREREGGKTDGFANAGYESACDDGLTNIFQDSMLSSEGVSRSDICDKRNPFEPRTRCVEKGLDSTRVTKTADGDDCSRAGESQGGGRLRGGGTAQNVFCTRMQSWQPANCTAELMDVCQRGKGSVEGSSSSAELQARLEASWAALHVPARLKLDFLQKYCTLERALELPTMVQLLDTAGKAVPLREKVLDCLRRIEDDGEPMTAPSIFSAVDKDDLCGLLCWISFSAAAKPGSIGCDARHDDMSKTDADDDELVREEATATRGGCEGMQEDNDAWDRKQDGSIDGLGWQEQAERQAQDENNGHGQDGGPEGKRWASRRVGSREQAIRRREAAAVISWLRTIESRLVKRCADVCDAAWYELGEKITYQGRSVANSLPHGAMDGAMQRREDREDDRNSRRTSVSRTE